MEVKKGIVKLTSESTNSAYRIVQTYDAEVFEKTDGNYKEVIARKIDSAVILYDVASGNLVDETHTYNDTDFKVFPNKSLDEYYNSLNITAYSVDYTEPLVVI